MLNAVHPRIVFIVIGLTIMLMTTTQTVSCQNANDRILEPIPSHLREKLQERLLLLLEYERTRQWEKEFDLLSKLYLQGESKEEFIKTCNQIQSNDPTYKILNFAPISIITEDGSETDGHWVMNGCCRFQEKGKTKHFRASIGLYLEGGQWFLTPILFDSYIGSSRIPCEPR